MQERKAAIYMLSCSNALKHSKLSFDNIGEKSGVV